MQIKRVFVEKKPEFSGLKEKFKSEWTHLLNIETGDLKIFLRYDIEWDGETEVFDRIVSTILSEPPVDDVYYEELPELSGYSLFAVELLPGQFDQRADSAGQCIQLLTGDERPAVRYATVYAVEINEDDLAAVKKYIINPVEAREAELIKPDTLDLVIEDIPKEEKVDGFNSFSQDEITEYHRAHGFAMNVEDLLVIQQYFKKEGRDPNFIELKVVDTYWSDHCRHTTFLTRLDDITVTGENPALSKALSEYRVVHNVMYGKREDKYTCFMDIATIAGKYLSKQGLLDNLDSSDEINACSIKVKANIDGAEEDWLVMFKNETHNHPTEIEPFGGAATCLGGAIRDPLSGRVYVYQAMRVTGSADVRTPISDTMEGKLPTRIISKTAAAGFSSYGNQIGLATGIVAEITHPNYAAKRLETGFVVGAAPAKNVVRAVPESGDIVLLIGGETGRDGCGGATGSSKAHSTESVSVCGAEVQKGNAPTERKLQRLFRNPAFTQCVKRCNDFGAGGVSVAIGELSEGLDIYLDKVPKKYEGLSALELAISESQERMAVVVPAVCKDYVIALAAEENLNAAHVADVTDLNRMRMFYDGEAVVDMSRDLLNSNGAVAHAKAVISEGRIGYFDNLDEITTAYIEKENFAGALSYELSRPNVCINMGLSENFDSTIGAGTVLMPFGGDSFMTPAISMAALLPVTKGETTTATVASWGYDPDLSSESPFVGSIYSIINSIAKVVATGADFKSIRLTLQEYFMKLGRDPKRWGVPAAALLGAFYTQIKLGIAAIGGKDSMSGSFERLDVPPTLISFALGIANADKIITNVLKEANKKVYLMPLPRDNFGVPDFERFKKMMQTLSVEINSGNVNFATVVENGGAYSALAKSLMGSKTLGFDFVSKDKNKFLPLYGNILFSCEDTAKFSELNIDLLGETNSSGIITFVGNSLKTAAAAYSAIATFSEVYPPVSSVSAGEAELLSFNSPSIIKSNFKCAKPKVLIPVFPGTNCEYDTAKRFNIAGAESKILVFKNLSAESINDSIKAIAENLKKSQILAFSGGFSAGDEPDGSGKFIATAYRNPILIDAISEFMERDGLIIGICNGFQVLVKTGLLPFGKMSDMTTDSPTLTFNDISRHVSVLSRVKITSNISPWLQGAELGGEYLVPISHGEGKFICTDTDLQRLIDNGQIFSQYVDDSGFAATSSPFNPNGSKYAIEGITSADGRILGKMGHSERIGKNLYKNVSGEFDIKLFESGVKYFE